MNTHRVAVIFADGTVGRSDFGGKVSDEAVQAAYDQANAGPWSENPAASWRWVTLDDFPDSADNYFGKAWRDDGKQITIDMDAAKDIQRDVLRHERARVMPQLDIEYNNAVRLKDTALADAIEAERQRLRDIPALPAIEEATTPAELKEIVVEVSL